MPRLQILIAGGGLGGLALAIMLERLPEHKKVDYLILERTVWSNPMGSAISLHASVIPLLKQLGLWTEIERASKPMSHFSIKREDGSDLGTVDFSYGQLDYSYYGMVLARPDLHEILLSHIPTEKILTGKRIGSMTQDEVGVSVHCSDGSIYHGDILVGADGAYSAVRQSLYKELRAHGNLPRQDFTPIKLDQVVVVGITESLSPQEYPLLKEDVCQFRIVLGGKERPYTMWMVPLSNNRIAWSIGGRSDALAGSSFWSESQEEAFKSMGLKSHQYSRFPDWGEAESESIEEICEQMRTKQNPFGYGTYGDLIDKTPRHLISRIMFEERGFRTWYGGRTVLIGDACHKSVPFGGQGVVNAMFDGACLVNLIHDLPSNPSMQDLADTFQTYFEKRYPAARIAIEGSSQFSRLFHDQAQVEEDGRVVMFNSIPRWLQRWTLDKCNRVDPKLEFILSSTPRTPSVKSFTSSKESNISNSNNNPSNLSININKSKNIAINRKNSTSTNGSGGGMNNNHGIIQNNIKNNIFMSGSSGSSSSHHSSINSINDSVGQLDKDELALMERLTLRDRSETLATSGTEAFRSELSGEGDELGFELEIEEDPSSASASETLGHEEVVDSTSASEIHRGRTLEILHSAIIE